MKASDVKTGNRYAYADYMTRRIPLAEQAYMHADVIVAGINSYDKLEAAGYVVPRPAGGGMFGRERIQQHGAAERERVQQLVDAGTHQRLPGDEYELRRLFRGGNDTRGTFNTMHLVRLTAETRLDHRSDQVRTIEFDQPRVRLVPSIHLRGDLDELLAETSRTAARFQQRTAELAQRQAARDAELAEINELLATRGIDARPDARARDRASVALTLDELRQLAGATGATDA